MALKLIYITNDAVVAKIAESVGVDRIMVDMEYIGKAARQQGLDTVMSHHTVEDVQKIRSAVKSSEVLVRINPVHDKSEEYCSTEEEVDRVIDAGADIIMLPYFKTGKEVERFLSAVNGRVKTMLLLETPEAAESVEEIVKVKGFDEIHVGLNDLSIGYGRRFMFELVADGTVENLCRTFKRENLVYGFGGIASLGKGMLPAEYILKEHYRLGSHGAILSRSFCNTSLVRDYGKIREIFESGVKEIRDFEKLCRDKEFVKNSRAEIKERVDAILKGI